MKNQKKTIKEEIREKFRKKFVIDEPPTPPYIEDEFDIESVESFIYQILKEILQCFIEETRLETKYRKDEVFRKCPYCGELVEVGSICNQTIIELNQKQQQWLKENL